MANMNKMFKKMQKLQKDMEKLQEELADKEITHSAGGGMVVATVNGRQDLVDIKIDPEAIDPEDAEMLEDMVIAAVNGAMTEASEMAQKEMSKMTGLPGMGGMPGLG